MYTLFRLAYVAPILRVRVVPVYSLDIIQTLGWKVGSAAKGWDQAMAISVVLNSVNAAANAGGISMSFLPISFMVS